MSSTHGSYEAPSPKVEDPQTRIVSEARKMEALATSSVEAFASQLHNMPKDERLAVMKQIQQDQKTRPVPDLPNLQFTDDGQLKSADPVHKTPGYSEHKEFDPNTGHKKSEDFKTPSTTVHAEYDNNGVKKSSDYTGPDRSVHIDYSGGVPTNYPPSPPREAESRIRL